MSSFQYSFHAIEDDIDATDKESNLSRKDNRLITLQTIVHVLLADGALEGDGQTKCDARELDCES